MRQLIQWPLLGLFLLCLTACQQEEASSSANAQTPSASPVNVVTLKAQAVTLTRSLPARTVALRKAEVRPQVNGIIEKRLFEEGAQVESGQHLYQIEPALFEANLANAEAGLVRAKAALTTAKARETRYKKLVG